MKRLFSILTLVIIAHQQTLAQDSDSLTQYLGNSVSTDSLLYYFIVGNDTTWCKKLEYGTTPQGNLNRLEYTDQNGKEVLLKKKDGFPDIVTFYLNGAFFDKIPFTAHKPKSYIRYTKRIVDGKLKVYLSLPGYGTGIHSHYTMSGSIGFSQSSGQTGVTRFFIKMPNGTYYDINKKKNIKKYIKPYLTNCEKFNEWYKGNFSNKREEFIMMIHLYNSLCYE